MGSKDNEPGICLQLQGHDPVRIMGTWWDGSCDFHD